MGEALQTMKLREGWIHGGYASPEFSGVRCSGPAVTAMFCNEIEGCLSLDVSIVFPMTSHVRQRVDFPIQLARDCSELENIIESIQKKVQRKQLISPDLHLIGDLADNTWQRTTAHTEAELPRVVDHDCAIKRSLEICKVISSKQQTFNEDIQQTSAAAEDDDVPAKKIRLMSDHTALEKYTTTGTMAKAEMRHLLNRRLTYEHIQLSAAKEGSLKRYKKVTLP